MNIEPNDIDAIIGKDLSGEISPDEKTLLNDWLLHTEENRIYYDHCKVLFEKSAQLKHQEIFDTDAAWNTLKTKIKEQNRKQTFISFSWRIAASLLILAVSGIFVYQKFYTIRDQVEVTSLQAVADQTLPDGTAIFLNKNTSVSYAYDPAKKIRKTKLAGEAYFKIAEKEKQDFLLEVNELLIKDIGTSFNVKAYPESDSVEVYVESGEVIFYTTENAGLHLKEKETGIYIKSSKTFSKLIEEDQNILAYKTQIFVFDNSKLADVIEAINEVYEVKLKLGAQTMENCRITVTFKHESIDMIAEVIAETLSLTIEKTEHEITLNGNGCAK